MSHSPVRWRKSSYSVGNNSCVELAAQGGDVLLRDSKHPANGWLTLPASTAAAIVTAAKGGHLDTLGA